MRYANRLAAGAVALIVLAAVATPVVAGEATVGFFVQELAKVKNLNATDPQIAADSLRGVGVRLPEKLDLSKRLTEADVATISRAAGLLVTTSNPTAYFDDEKVDRFFQSFSIELGNNGSGSGAGLFGGEGDCALPDGNCENPGGGSGPGTGNGNGPPFDPFSKGRGKARGKAKQSRTPTDPE